MLQERGPEHTICDSAAEAVDNFFNQVNADDCIQLELDVTRRDRSPIDLGYTDTESSEAIALLDETTTLAVKRSVSTFTLFGRHFKPKTSYEVVRNSSCLPVTDGQTSGWLFESWEFRTDGQQPLKFQGMMKRSKQNDVVRIKNTLLPGNSLYNYRMFEIIKLLNSAQDHTATSEQ